MTVELPRVVLLEPRDSYSVEDAALIRDADLAGVKDASGRVRILKDRHGRIGSYTISEAQFRERAERDYGRS